MNDTTDLDISDLDTAAVLAGLFNAIPVRSGDHRPDANEDMSIDEAREWLELSRQYSSIRGRVIQVRFQQSGIFNPRLYDRDNGQGAARAIVDFVRSEQERSVAHG